jgi:hypothetical protein
MRGPLGCLRLTSLMHNAIDNLIEILADKVMLTSACYYGS